MHKFLKNILLISISIVLLTSVLIVGVLWTYSNDIPDYKFLKKLQTTGFKQGLLRRRRACCRLFSGKKSICALQLNP